MVVSMRAVTPPKNSSVSEIKWNPTLLKFAPSCNLHTVRHVTLQHAHTDHVRRHLSQKWDDRWLTERQGEERNEGKKHRAERLIIR